MKTFELNGKTYETDAATLEILRGIIPAAKASGDMSAVFAMLHFGTLAGRIRESAR